MSDLNELLVKREPQIKILRKKVCVEKPGSHKYCVIVGPEGSGKTAIAQMLKNERKVQENVFWVSTSLAEVEKIEGVKSPFWWFWAYMLNAFVEQVPMENIEKLADEKDMEDKEELAALRDIYKFWGDSSKYSVLDTCEGARADITHLFECYTELEIQIIWEIDCFDRMEELYPEDAEEELVIAGDDIYSLLFELSPKGIATYNLNLLFLSRRKMGDLEGERVGGSYIKSACSEFNFYQIDGIEYK